MNQRLAVIFFSQQFLKSRPSVSVGNAPEVAYHALGAIVCCVDGSAAKLLGPIRSHETTPDPQLHRERLLRISPVILAHFSQRPVDVVVFCQTGGARGLQLTPTCQDDYAAKNA